jgi:hypothetical protein
MIKLLLITASVIYLVMGGKPKITPCCKCCFAKLFWFLTYKEFINNFHHLEYGFESCDSSFSLVRLRTYKSNIQNFW